MSSPVFGFSIVAMATILLYTITFFAPSIKSPLLTDSMVLRFPRNLEDLTGLAALLNHYKEQHMGYVFLLFCSAYVYKQCFAIPGSVFLNVLAGALFGFYTAFPLVCFLTAVGASGCYMLSRLFAKQYVEKYLPVQVASLQARVNDNMDHLFIFLVFLRLIPMTPNWLLNISSPLVKIPLPHFFFSVFLGLMPYNFVCVQTGGILAEIKSLDQIFTWSTLLKMSGVAGAAFGLFVLKKVYLSNDKNKPHAE